MARAKACPRVVLPTRNAFNEQMAAGEYADQSLAGQLRLLARITRRSAFFQLDGFVGYGNGGLGRHWLDFHYRPAPRSGVTVVLSF